MKFLSKHSKYVAITALLIVFTLQGIWLYQTFLMTKENLQKDIFEKLATATRKETQKRYKEFLAYRDSKKKNEIAEKNKAIFTMPNDSLWAHKKFPVDIMYLELLNFKKYQLKLYRIDSILKNNNDIKGKFAINKVIAKNDSVVESSAPQTKSLWNDAYKSEKIPLLVDESESLQLYLFDPNWAIFHQMLSIILLSLLVGLIVLLMLYWQYKLYEEEKKMRAYQKEHTEAVVHNMATPLQTIDIISESLEKNTIDTSKKEMLIKVRKRQIANLKSQINEMLTISKAKKSRIALHKKTILIENLVNEVCIPLKNNKHKEISIKTHFELATPTANIDVKLFSDALRNLVSNAIKYSRELVQIDVTTICTEKKLKVMVADKGIGIEPKYQKSIFKKFNRGELFSQQGVRGFGIGLSFVKVVIEAHKGSISLYSKGKNEGSVFTVCIPQ